MMSIHAAKGLEFPVVFLSAMHRGPDRRTPVILFSADCGLGIKWRNPATGKGIGDISHRVLSARRKTEEEAEEYRLLYVAMTRAEDRLILSYAERKQQSGRVKLANRVERFDNVEERGLPGTGPQTGKPPLQAIRDGSANRKACSTPSAGIILDKAVPSGQYDSSASVTSAALFDACPRKYFLSRYIGLDPEPNSPGTGAIQLGLDVHGALAGQPVESLEALDLAQRFHASELGKRAARATRIEREFDFQIAWDDVVLRGQIDLWFEEGGELIVVDYKTDRDESSHGSYALQLRLYAAALELYAGRSVGRAVLFYLRSGRDYEVSVIPQDLESARAVIRAFRDAQDSLKFPMKVGEQCRHCPFWRVQCDVSLPN